ncbi:type II toxin-antitoxin system Phd/YefM family antitoxin [Patescibacteria group bacterium]|nr:type II toxin-antitoxin system Phd/YefM family antitoxin [Patescibacteria group bacterium]
MNVISSTVLRNNLSDSLKVVEKKKKFLLVAKRGKITSALVNLDLFEDLLELADSKYLKSIKKARQEYKKGDFFSHKDAFGEV